MKTYTKAVSATLAGALAVGMVPAMALADEAADSSLELLFTAGDAADVAAGSIVAAVDNKGGAVSLSGQSFTDGPDTGDSAVAQYIVPTKVKTYSGLEIDLVNGANKDDYETKYYKVVATGGVAAPAWAAEGEKIVLQNVTDPWTAGTYYAAVQAKVGNEAGVLATVVKFTIESASLDSAFFVEDNNVKDTSFVYTGQPLNLGLTFGETMLTGSEYSVVWYKDGKQYDSDGQGANDPLEAGTYTAKIDGAGLYETYLKDRTVVVEKMNLSSSTIDLGEATYEKVDSAKVGIAALSDGSNISVNGIYAPANGVKVTLKSGPTGETVDPAEVAGTYVYTVANANPTLFPSIEGTQDITVVRYANDAVIQYDGGTYAGLQTGEAFDADEITVTANNAAKTALPYTVKYLKAHPTIANQWDEVTDITKPGDYKAVVTVSSADSAVNYAWGGQVEMPFTVDTTKINASTNVFVTYNGQIGTEFDIEYTGENVIDLLKVEVLDAKKNKLVEGTDYVVEVKADGAAKATSEAVKVGGYTLTVKPAEGSIYEFTGGATVDIDIVKSAIEDLAVANVITYGDKTGLACTGEKIIPTFEYFHDNGKDGKKGTVDDVIENLDSSMYKIEKYYYADGVKADGKTINWVAVEEMLKPGKYTVQIALTAAGNACYDLTDNQAVVEVIEGSYIDVLPGKWYSEAIEGVSELGWMNGYAGTNVFGTYDTMNRAQFVCMLYNMAGGKAGDDNATNSVGGYIAEFSDVPVGAYYAQAVAWAAKTGVANGHDGKFMPNAPVTREQAAAFFWNYCDYIGKDVQLSAAEINAALEPCGDEQKVSGWAKEPVAWAVANGIMANTEGKMINPKATIIRAEAACMAYNMHEAKIL